MIAGGVKRESGLQHQLEAIVKGDPLPPAAAPRLLALGLIARFEGRLRITRAGARRLIQLQEEARRPLP